MFLFVKNINKEAAFPADVLLDIEVMSEVRALIWPHERHQ